MKDRLYAGFFILHDKFMLIKEPINTIFPENIDKIILAYSGGVDSHVLLHWLCSTLLKEKVTAVYINHGLQQQAEQWGQHCRSISEDLGIGFQSIRVNAQKIKGSSLEEVARDKRYAALKGLLGEQDVLLLAQHREDQMETVFLQLFRGAGPCGLSGMPASIAFGKGLMLRPLLATSKQDILSYAQKNSLQWVEDPSNQSHDFDRNFLRNHIIPQLKQRWKGVDKTVARSARHCAVAEENTQQLAQLLVEGVIDCEHLTVNIPCLLKLSAHQQHLVIRRWFKQLNLRMPSEKRLVTILSEVVLAGESKNPQLKGENYAIRRYRETLYCLPASKHTPIFKEKEWLVGKKKIRLNQYSHLSLIDASSGIPKAIWDQAQVSIKFRQGSEKIKLVGRGGSHSLKKLFQEAAVPPWERDTLPLVYIDQQLAAISDRWISADFYSEDGVCYQLNWSGERGV